MKKVIISLLIVLFTAILCVACYASDSVSPEGRNEMPQYTLAISIISLIVSVIALMINIIKYLYERFNIKIIPLENECLYIDPIDTVAGNTVSIVLHLRIINKSNYPITISSFVNCALTSSSLEMEIALKKIPTDLHESDQYNKLFDPVSIPTSEGAKYLKFTTEYINQPAYLNSFEEVTGYVVFPFSKAPLSDKVEKLKFKLITSRGNKEFKCKVITQEYIKTWFT